MSLNIDPKYNNPNYSVIFLLDNFHPEFPQFVQEVYDLFISKNLSFEIIIMINGLDGFFTGQSQELEPVMSKGKVFFMNKKTSQSTCIQAGVKQCKGQIILACQGIQQINIQDIGFLLDSFDSNTDLIAPFRQKRIDPSINQIQSKIFNWIVKKLSKIEVHDLSCTIKLFRREIIENIPLYGNMYRFLPLFAFRNGYQVKEIPCQHHKEYQKTGLYSPSVYFAKLIDMVSLFFIFWHTRKPLRFFSFLGAITFFIGIFICLVITWQKIIMGYPVGDREILLIGILFMVFGLQIGSSGLLGEIIAFIYGRSQKDYWIEKKTN